VPETVEFRPRLGRGLTVAVGVLAVCGVVVTAVEEPATAMLSGELHGERPEQAL